jgi:RHS repeat-associated protein
MGFFLKSEPAGKNRTAEVFLCRPKTLTPDPPLQEVGLRFYSPPLARWLSRDPMENLAFLNLYVALANNPVNSVDVDGLFVINGANLPNDVAGKTEFNPRITVNSVTVNFCCCSISTATWAANTIVYIPANPDHPAYKSTTVQQIISHESVHASSDDALAAKALPVAITYLQGACIQKSFLYAAFSGGWNWTTAQCQKEMQSQGDNAAASIQTLAYSVLTTQAHSFIGAYPSTWNPAGVSKWNTWFAGWLAGGFNGGKYW